MPPLDATHLDLGRVLQEEWSRSTAIVHQAPASEIDAAAANTVALLKGLSEHRDGIEKVARFVREASKPVLEAEQFFSEESQEILLRIAASSREWAPRYAGLAIAEDHPLATAFRAWIRPYNDAVRETQRALVDLADAFERRVAEERAETAEANAWAARRSSRARDDEETVSLAELKAQLSSEG